MASCGTVAASGGYYIASARRPHHGQPRHRHRQHRRHHAVGQRRGPDQETRTRLLQPEGRALKGHGLALPLHDPGRKGRTSRVSWTTSTSSLSTTSPATARFPVDKVKALAEGRVYTGEEAKQAGPGRRVRESTPTPSSGPAAWAASRAKSRRSPSKGRAFPC